MANYAQNGIFQGVLYAASDALARTPLFASDLTRFREVVLSLPVAPMHLSVPCRVIVRWLGVFSECGSCRSGNNG